MKIDHILFPVDFSDHSRALNKEVEWLATRSGARVTLLHVFEIPTSWYGGGEYPLITSEDIVAFKNAEKQRLAEYSLAVPENRITRIAAEGGAASHIARLAGHGDVDLIVMGTHGYGKIRRFLLGSVAMRVLHEVSCPVWTHSAATESSAQFKKIDKIICAIELTDEALPLLQFTKQLAADFGASVQLIHRVPEAAEYRYLNSVVHDQLIEMSREEIRAAQHTAGTEAPVTLVEKSIAEAAAELAAAEQADLIIIGRGKIQLSLGTLRSHGYDIIRQAPCPVLSFATTVSQADEEKGTYAEVASASIG